MPEKEQADTELQILVFELDGQPYGLDISAVREVVHMQTVLRTREVASTAEGAVSLRGRAVPVIDLRQRMGMERGRRTDAQRVVVVDAGGAEIGAIVDAVTEVCRVAAGEVESAGGRPEYVSGVVTVGSRRVLLLDPSRLVSPGEVEGTEAA